MLFRSRNDFYFAELFSEMTFCWPLVVSRRVNKFCQASRSSPSESLKDQFHSSPLSVACAFLLIPPTISMNGPGTCLTGYFFVEVIWSAHTDCGWCCIFLSLIFGFEVINMKQGKTLISDRENPVNARKASLTRNEFFRQKETRLERVVGMHKELKRSSGALNIFTDLLVLINSLHGKTHRKNAALLSRWQGVAGVCASG